MPAAKHSRSLPSLQGCALAAFQRHSLELLLPVLPFLARKAERRRQSSQVVKSDKQSFPWSPPPPPLLGNKDTFHKGPNHHSLRPSNTSIMVPPTLEDRTATAAGDSNGSANKKRKASVSYGHYNHYKGLNTSMIKSKFLSNPEDLGVVAVGFSGGQV